MYEEEYYYDTPSEDGGIDYSLLYDDLDEILDEDLDYDYVTQKVSHSTILSPKSLFFSNFDGRYLAYYSA